MAALALLAACLLASAAGFSATPETSGTMLVVSINSGEVPCSPTGSGLKEHFRALFEKSGIKCGWDTVNKVPIAADQPDIIMVNLQEAPIQKWFSSMSDDIRDAVLYACGMSYDAADTKTLLSARKNIGGTFTGRFKRYRKTYLHTMANVWGFTQRQTIFYRNKGNKDSIGAKWVDGFNQFNMRLDKKTKWLLGTKAVLATRLQIVGGKSLVLAGAHLPMRSSDVATFGLNNRADSIAAIYKGLGSILASKDWRSSPMVLAGDLNFRVDDNGEQLTRCIKEDYMGLFGRYKSNGEPPYVSCRFAEAPKALKFNGGPTDDDDEALLAQTAAGKWFNPNNGEVYLEPMSPVADPKWKYQGNDVELTSADADAVQKALKAASSAFLESPTKISAFKSSKQYKDLLAKGPKVDAVEAALDEFIAYASEYYKCRAGEGDYAVSAAEKDKGLVERATTTSYKKRNNICASHKAKYRNQAWSYCDQIIWTDGAPPKQTGAKGGKAGKVQKPFPDITVEDVDERQYSEEKLLDFVPFADPAQAQMIQKGRLTGNSAGGIEEDFGDKNSGAIIEIDAGNLPKDGDDDALAPPNADASGFTITYDKYLSLPLCIMSDHNAIVGVLRYSFGAAPVPAPVKRFADSQLAVAAASEAADGDADAGADAAHSSRGARGSTLRRRAHARAAHEAAALDVAPSDEE